MFAARLTSRCTADDVPLNLRAAVSLPSLSPGSAAACQCCFPRVRAGAVALPAVDGVSALAQHCIGACGLAASSPVWAWACDPYLIIGAVGFIEGHVSCVV